MTTSRLFLLTTLFIAGCASPTWQGHPKPDESAISRALNGSDQPVAIWDLPPESLPSFPVPQNVRPCCAFGNLQKVKVGPVPIPLFRLGNTVAPNKVGPHRFDGGTFNYTSSGMSGNNNRGSENNGVLYTARGGFIDLAHVRDTADDTVALFFQIFRKLGEAHIIEVPDEIGRRYVRMHAFDVSELSGQERWQLSAALAARLAYFKAESHEIAQWHNYASFAGWPETVSAFSPEDLYSNMLGAKLTMALINAQLVLNDQLYNQSLTVWLDATLEWLGEVDKKTTNALFDVVDGHWWDSTRPIPDKFMVLKRHYGLGDRQLPYLVPESMAADHSAWPKVAALYRKPNTPHSLHLTDTLFGLALDDLGELVMEVSDGYAASFADIPESLWRDGFTHREFSEIASYAAQADAIQLEALSTP
ncbi:DUF4056 domain-containing protein [Ferrimonas balearica]|uniref:DUF4056 domain-containing protein n=1 Tax=Ferrimonas balearica TaxID=44012 RepID=UPI001C9952CB|nr:DUF4056 domain-containing protein [Ferrimonas balearica]MBY5921751.1 DUF4056 domain-containing protein [Ferrimonas balearica]MBY5994909.1 DUF4056 domain-containing protein [Ferrimonas balearica]